MAKNNPALLHKHPTKNGSPQNLTVQETQRSKPDSIQYLTSKLDATKISCARKVRQEWYRLPFVTLTHFHKFMELPAEIRIKIWKLAIWAQEPRVYEVWQGRTAIPNAFLHVSLLVFSGLQVRSPRFDCSIIFEVFSAPRTCILLEIKPMNTDESFRDREPRLVAAEFYDLLTRYQEKFHEVEGIPVFRKSKDMIHISYSYWSWNSMTVPKYRAKIKGVQCLVMKTWTQSSISPDMGWTTDPVQVLKKIKEQFPDLKEFIMMPWGFRSYRRRVDTRKKARSWDIVDTCRHRHRKGHFGSNARWFGEDFHFKTLKSAEISLRQKDPEWDLTMLQGVKRQGKIFISRTCSLKEDNNGRGCFFNHQIVE